MDLTTFGINTVWAWLNRNQSMKNEFPMPIGSDKPSNLPWPCGMLGEWYIDESHYIRERQHSIAYLSNVYQENWLVDLETLLVERGLVIIEEIASGISQQPATGYRVPSQDAAAKILSSGSLTRMAI